MSPRPKEMPPVHRHFGAVGGRCLPAAAVAWASKDCRGWAWLQARLIIFLFVSFFNANNIKVRCIVAKFSFIGAIFCFSAYKNEFHCLLHSVFLSETNGRNYFLFLI